MSPSYAWLDPGIHAEVPAAVYHDDPSETPSLSSSIAKILCTQSPAHARAAHPRLNPDYRRVDEQKYDLGTLAHSILLQGIDLAHIVHAPDWRTKDAKEQRDNARMHGRIPLLAGQYDDVKRMVEAVRAQLERFDADPAPLTNGQAEKTIMWDEDGVPCRARIDWLHDGNGTIDDLKSTSRSAYPTAWVRSSLVANGYDLQAAFYRRGVQAVSGVTPVWRWIVVETSAPYAVSVLEPGPDVLALGDAKVDHALAVWKRCVAEDSWPAYPTRVATVELPGWAEGQWLEREAEEVGV